MRRACVLALPLLCLAAPAFAVDPQAVDLTAPLPTFARAPQATSADPGAFWKGLSYGVEAIGVSGKGIKGGVGGAANVAWRTAIDDRLSVQFKTSAGYMPGLWKAPAFGGTWAKSGITGSNFVLSEASVGYDMGRVRPWASVGVGFAKPTRYGGFSGGLNSINSMFDGEGKSSRFVAVGAGVDYAVTDKLTIGVAVHGLQAK